MNTSVREELKKKIASYCDYLDIRDSAMEKTEARNAGPRPSQHDVIKSAVLLPFFFEDNVWKTILTLRNPSVAAYPKEVSFPGGSAEESDVNLIETALRESYEEIGLKKEKVEVLGCLEDLFQMKRKSNRTGELKFHNVACVVGILDKDFGDFNINRQEVDDIIVCPVHELLDNVSYRKYKTYTIVGSTITVNNKTYSVYGFSFALAISIALVLDIIPTSLKKKSFEHLLMAKSINSPKINYTLDYILLQNKNITEKSNL